MSESGHSRRFAHVRGMSAYPLELGAPGHRIQSVLPSAPDGSSSAAINCRRSGRGSLRPASWWSVSSGSKGIDRLQVSRKDFGLGYPG